MDWLTDQISARSGVALLYPPDVALHGAGLEILYKVEMEGGITGV